MSYKYMILKNDKTHENVALLLTSDDIGVFYRDSGRWIQMEDDDELPFSLDTSYAVDVDENETKVWDSLSSKQP